VRASRAVLLLAAVGLALGDCGGAPHWRLESSPRADVHRFRRALPDSPGQVLAVRNLSNQVVEVRVLTLRDCRNVRGGCQAAIPLGIVLEHGEFRELLTIHPEDPDEPLSFRWGVGVTYVTR